MFVVTVTLTIKPESRAQFLPIMLENAQRSTSEEPGCHQFDVCISLDNENEVLLYELYDDEDAFATHLQTPHFLAFNDATANMVTSKVVRTFTRAAASA